MLGNLGVAKVSTLQGVEPGTLKNECGHISCCTMHGDHMSFGRSNLFMNPTEVTMYQCLTTERACYGWTVKNGNLVLFVHKIHIRVESACYGWTVKNGNFVLFVHEIHVHVESSCYGCTVKNKNSLPML